MERPDTERVEADDAMTAGATAEGAGDVAANGREREREGPGILFDRPPASPEALALTSRLVELVTRHEGREGRRQRGRGEKGLAALREAVGRLAGGLAASVDTGKRLPVSFPKNNNAYSAAAGTGLPVTRKATLAAYDAFLGTDPPLIAVVTRGYRRKLFEADPAFGSAAAYQGRRERIRATPTFVGLLRGHGIAGWTADRHFPRPRRPEPLVLRGPSEWWRGEKFPGRRLKFPADDPDARRLAAEVEELNDHVAGVRVEGAELDGWTRIFTAGPKGKVRWDRGGRLYARPGAASYQSLSKAERAAIRLDGEPAVELDIRASHLALAYALRGGSLATDLRLRGEDDPYLVGGLPRAVVKLFVTATLGAGKALDRWPKGKAAELLAEEGEKQLDLRPYKVRDVREAVLARHPLLADLAGLGWGRLQHVEGEAVMRAVLRLKREFGVPALPVHDSLIVPVPAWRVARDVLWLELVKATGREPVGIRPTLPQGRLPRPGATPRYAEAERKLLGELGDF